MQQRIVIVLGGNALGDTLEQQQKAVQSTAGVIADLVQQGHRVIVSHGNGPQVGIIQNAMNALSREEPEQGTTPLYISGAMSQAYIGFDLQNALRFQLRQRELPHPVCTLLTQCLVDPQDPAFSSPSKPIGKFLSRQDAQAVAQKNGYLMKEDAGRGYRRYVPSPQPRDIVEKDSISLLSDSGAVVICCGGGGVPVIRDKEGLRGIDAVIDKDFASELLAEELKADRLVILTAVEKVAIHYKTEREQALDRLTPQQARQYEREGHFAAGSMLPKVQAAVRFAESSPGRKAIITHLYSAQEALAGHTGTVVAQ